MLEASGSHLKSIAFHVEDTSDNLFCGCSLCILSYVPALLTFPFAVRNDTLTHQNAKVFAAESISFLKHICPILCNQILSTNMVKSE